MSAAFRVHTDMVVNLSFTQNSKQNVNVALNLKAGDDAEEILAEFMLCERVPVYLEANIFCAVHTLLQQERNSWECKDYGAPDCEQKVQAWADNFKQQHKRQLWYPTDDMDADGIGSKAFEDLDERKAKDATFARNFHALVNSSSTALARVLDLERQNTVALGQFVAGLEEVRS